MGKLDNKGDTDKQTQQIEDLTKISLKKEPLHVGIDEEELPQWMDGAGQAGVSPVLFRKKCYFSGLGK